MPKFPSSQLSSRSPLSPQSSDSEISLTSPSSAPPAETILHSPSLVYTASGDIEHSGSTILVSTDEELLDGPAAEQAFTFPHFH